MNNLIELINGIILIVKNFLRKIKDQKYNKLYPINPKHDDVYIVEFPRSGITWLSTLIANVNLLASSLILVIPSESLVYGAFTTFSLMKS